MIKIESVRSHHTERVYWISGPIKEVIAEVNDRLQNDHVTYMYEHMRLRIIEVDTSELHLDKIRFKMYKNLYAGD